MVTGHRQLAHRDLVAARLGHILAKLDAREAVSGGAQGADAVFADVALGVGVLLHLMLPNRWYRAHYPASVSDEVVAAATRVTYVVDRPDVADWDQRWTTERWWQDNFARNTAMIDVSDVTIVVSPRHPRVLLTETAGGTAGCVAEIRRRRGELHRVIWLPDDPSREITWTSLQTTARAAQLSLL